MSGYTTSFGANFHDVYIVKTDSAGNSGCNERVAATIETTVTPAVASGTNRTTPPTVVLSHTTTVIDFSAADITFCFNCDLAFADFSQCKNGTRVDFVDNSACADDWQWDFGDGQTSLLQNPRHTYASAGTYQVRLIAADLGTSCIDTALRMVTVDPVPIAEFSADSVCLGTPTSFFDQTTDTIISYQWYFGDGDSSTLQNPQHSYANSGTFTTMFIATAISGCIDTAYSEIVVHPVPSVAWQQKDSCLGGVSRFTDSSSITSGSLSSFSWNFGDGNTANLPHFNHQYAAADTYQVSLTVTSDQGCVSSDTNQIEIFENPSVRLDSAHPVSCFGGTDGSLFISAFNGTAPYNFAWSDSTTNGDLSNRSAQTYAIVVTDANTCQTRDQWTIAEPDLLRGNMITTNPDCFGGTDGSIDLTVSGGNFPFTYSWSTGDTTEDLATLPMGSYSVSVVDRKGCSWADSISLTQSDSLYSEVTMAHVTCFGDSSGSIDLRIIGGVFPYDFTWSSGDTTEDINTLAAGRYAVVVEDNNGCIILDSVEITEPSPIQSTGNVSHVACFGGTDGAIDLQVSGGVSPYQFAWTTTEITEDVNSLQAGIYAVTITDSNTCAHADSFEILQNAAVSINLIADSVRCFSGSDGRIESQVSGGTPAYSLTWSNGDSTVIAGQLSAGTYSVTATDINGCTVSATTDIHEPAPLVLNGTAQEPNCHNADDGSINTQVTGGIPGYAYSWSNGDTSDQTSGLSSGLYALTVADRNGCVDTISFSLRNPELMTIDFTTDSTSCNGPEFEDATAIAHVRTEAGRRPYLFSLNGAVFQADSIFTDLPAGNYTVEARDNKGCEVAGGFQIFQPPPLVVEIIPDTATIELGGSIELNTLVNQPGQYTYFWSPVEGLSCSDCPNPIASPFATIDYHLMLEEFGDERAACRAETSVRVLVLDNHPYFIPNSFTPNGDGFNDVFRIFGENIKNAHTEIFNRIGERVFVSDDLSKGWDGTCKGEMQTPGVYVYSIRLNYLNDRIIDLKGSVTLIR